jgi:hypothetical protein
MKLELSPIVWRFAAGIKQRWATGAHAGIYFVPFFPQIYLHNRIPSSSVKYFEKFSPSFDAGNSILVQ